MEVRVLRRGGKDREEERVGGEGPGVERTRHLTGLGSPGGPGKESEDETVEVWWTYEKEGSTFGLTNGGAGEGSGG